MRQASRWHGEGRPTVALLLSAVLVAVCRLAVMAAAQETPSTNSLAGKPAVIQEGASLFRANCSPCHGLNARGGTRGPDLSTGRWTHGSSNADIFRTITQGVPGTEMPGASFEDSEIWTLVAYLRSLAPAKQAPGEPLEG